MRRAVLGHALCIMIVVVIAIAISAVIFGYVVGAWNVLGSKATEALEVLGDSFYNSTTNTVVLHIYANYRPYADVYRIELGSIVLNISKAKILRVERGRAEIVGSTLRIYAGTVAWISIPVDKPLYDTLSFVEIRLYTHHGFVYRGILKVVA